MGTEDPGFHLIIFVADAQVSDGKDDPLRDERVVSVGGWTVEQKLDAFDLTNLKWNKRCNVSFCGKIGKRVHPSSSLV